MLQLANIGDYGIYHRPERVLLVDDDDSTREVLTRVLHQRGWGVLPVAGPWDALEALRDPGLEIQVVLTDVRMPGISGELLAQHLRCRYPNLGIVVMTAWPDPHIEEACALAEVDVFLAKPFDSIDALVEALRIAAARHAAPVRA